MTYISRGIPKILGQSAPNATTETDLYTCSALTRVEKGLLVIANRANAVRTYRVSISVGGGETANKDYLFYNTSLAGNGTYTIDFGEQGIALSATDVVRVYASTNELSFTLFGTELK